MISEAERLAGPDADTRRFIATMSAHVAHLVPGEIARAALLTQLEAMLMRGTASCEFDLDDAWRGVAAIVRDVVRGVPESRDARAEAAYRYLIAFLRENADLFEQRRFAATIASRRGRCPSDRRRRSCRPS
jgi:hypothetical protein